MDLKVLEVRLTSDWKEVVKKSSFWVTTVFGFVMAAAPEIANQWPTLAPVVLQFFPASQREAIAPVLGALIILAAKLSVIRVGKKDDSSAS